MIKVIITDDHPVVRHGIREILEDDERISVIDEASDGKELIKKMLKQEYDVVLLDISLPGRSGLDLIKQIKKICKKTAVLILSMHSEEMYAIQAIKYGASGYLTKSSASEELLAAIVKVSEGEKYITSSLGDILNRSISTRENGPESQSLSAREMMVLDLFAEGKTVNQIAKQLILSPKTVSTYRERLLAKLHLKTTADLIRYRIMEGLKKDTRIK
ncbi:MAG TPA: response regulator transcription factor [Bacteroidales bacterium]|nr:response regulator transcription factor [Bacteroidales bacterium]